MTVFDNFDFHLEPVEKIDLLHLDQSGKKDKCCGHAGHDGHHCCGRHHRHTGRNNTSENTVD